VIHHHRLLHLDLVPGLQLRDRGGGDSGARGDAAGGGEPFVRADCVESWKGVAGASWNGSAIARLQVATRAGGSEDGTHPLVACVTADAVRLKRSGGYATGARGGEIRGDPRDGRVSSGRTREGGRGGGEREHACGFVRLGHPKRARKW
jgi:hypothetical protein